MEQPLLDRKRIDRLISAQTSLQQKRETISDIISQLRTSGEDHLLLQHCYDSYLTLLHQISFGDPLREASDYVYLYLLMIGNNCYLAADYQNYSLLKKIQRILEDYPDVNGDDSPHYENIASPVSWKFEMYAQLGDGFMQDARAAEALGAYARSAHYAALLVHCGKLDKSLDDQIYHLVLSQIAANRYLGKEISVDDDLFRPFSARLPRASREKVIAQASVPHLLHDSVEDTAAFLSIKEELDAVLYHRFQATPRTAGFCHRYWAEKKSILRDTYGISWRSPSEMNPGVQFN